MRKFDTAVQHLKYKVLREVARFAWEGTLQENLLDIPKIISPGKTASVRCCVYKERAILSERVKIAMGGDGRMHNVIEVIDIACDECPAAGYEVTDHCRGCIAHRCEAVCRRGAIYFDQKTHSARIDKEKCVECGACAKVCPYFAIIDRKRPCQVSCKVKAISINEDNAAAVDHNVCTNCGACVYQCPFGAITDKSYILDLVDLIKNKKERGERIVAVVAPAFAGQFSYVRPGQVINGLYELGFDDVCEAALGADMVALTEAKELAEKGTLISSCCPAFVAHIEKKYPTLLPYVSKTPSPMATIARYIKERDKSARIVFIGPCTAKKEEALRVDVSPYVDVVVTFEELQALFDSRDIDTSILPDLPFAGASALGRGFARTGGVSAAIAAALAEGGSDFALKPVICDGIVECDRALLRLSKGALDANFIEGMACVGGCIGGAGCLTHAERDKESVDRYAKDASTATSSDALALIED